MMLAGKLRNIETPPARLPPDVNLERFADRDRHHIPVCSAWFDKHSIGPRKRFGGRR